MLKENDDYKNQRLESLMKAVGNDRLAGEVCPNCFETRLLPDLHQSHSSSILKPNLVEIIGKGRIQQILAKIKALKNGSILKKMDEADEIMQEYLCETCKHSYVGELNFIAHQSETRVLSFFGYDDTKMYEKDFYSFSVLDDTYNSFIQKLWKDADIPPITRRDIVDSIEDIITGKVMGQLEMFFRKFAKEVYQDMGATVKSYTRAHAGPLEARSSGADYAIWIGPLTEAHIRLLNEYENGEIGFEELPVLVGNGIILQAKKEKGGSIDKKQIDDLVEYASISYKNHDYLGIPGKLFMKYSPNPPYVTVLPCDYTYALYNYRKSLPEHQKSISFPKTLNDLAEYATPIALPDFVQSYLSGKTGTPLLMLRDIFNTPGPKLIIGLPPEPIPLSGPPLAGLVNHWSSILEKRLAYITSEEELQEKQRVEQQWEEALQEQREEALRVQQQQEEEARRQAEYEYYAQQQVQQQRFTQ
jgi:hypothetical protein